MEWFFLYRLPLGATSVRCLFLWIARLNNSLEIYLWNSWPTTFFIIVYICSSAFNCGTCFMSYVFGKAIQESRKLTVYPSSFLSGLTVINMIYQESSLDFYLVVLVVYENIAWFKYYLQTFVNVTFFPVPYSKHTKWKLTEIDWNWLTIRRHETHTHLKNVRICKLFVLVRSLKTILYLSDNPIIFCTLWI